MIGSYCTTGTVRGAEQSHFSQPPLADSVAFQRLSPAVAEFERYPFSSRKKSLHACPKAPEVFPPPPTAGPLVLDLFLQPLDMLSTAD